MHENNDSSYEDDEEQAFRDYAFASQWSDITNANQLSLRNDNDGQWFMILRMARKKSIPKTDSSFGFEI